MSGPNPYAARKRLLALRQPAQRKMLRLVVACDQNKCTPIRVFGLREGLLALCRSDADVRDLQEQQPNLADWSKRRAFFLDEWMSLGDPDESRLQVVCDCSQTTPRLVDVRKVVDMVPAEGEATRRIVLSVVSASD